LSQGSLIREGDYSAERREACSNQAPAASEEWKIKPDRCVALIVGEEDDGIVPEGPYEAGDGRRGRKAVCLCKLRDEKTAPSDLFAEDGCGIADDGIGVVP
jgi:hypothetical protein